MGVNVVMKTKMGGGGEVGYCFFKGHKNDDSKFSCMLHNSKVAYSKFCFVLL